MRREQGEFSKLEKTILSNFKILLLRADILGNVDRTGFKPEDDDYESHINARWKEGHFQTQKTRCQSGF
jgi:hypothetical protein